MKNLDKEVETVWSASTREDKIKAMTDLIMSSHATKRTKQLALQKIVHISKESIDAFAVNYMMSGMGMKVS